METEVLIIGAGPTGLTLANQLIRYGIDFVIVDKKETLSELSKALVVHARSLEIYDQMGLGQKAVNLGQIMQKLRILQAGKIRAELPFSDIGQGLSPFPFALILEQSKNEQILLESLIEKGKNVFWQNELVSLSQNEKGITATLKNSKDETYEIEAKFLAGCDGAGSQTRNLLNLGFEGSTFPRLFYVADVEMEIDLPENILNVAIGRNAFVLLMPMKGDNQWRLIGNLPEDTDGDGEISYEEVEAKVKSLAQIPLDITKVHWFSSYKVHTRHAARFSEKRCFLAGDAAHIHTPAGGQGMNTGIQDAYNLAWKIAFVLKGWADEKFLETYNEERLANAIRLLQTTDEAFELATDDEWYIRIFREKFFPMVAKFALQFDAVKEFIFPTISQTGISYDKNSLSEHRGDSDFKIKAGNRFPFFRVDKKNVFEFLTEPKFHFLNFVSQNETFDFDREILEKFGEKIDFQTFKIDREVESVFGFSETFGILVRPDNYIAFITNENPLEEIERYFQKHLN
jgi:2-polyprenyl-6-methoxyphenol hydroxylase-like FAD-dependent oxidoreductase